MLFANKVRKCEWDTRERKSENQKDFLRKVRLKQKMTEVVGVVTGLTTELFEINQVSPSYTS